MKLIMALSADGFLCRSENDPMNWLPAIDKRIFRVITGVGGICAAGRKTCEVMPLELTGRRLLSLSRDGFTLDHLAGLYPDAWLLGGQTVALQAFLSGYIHEVHLCWSDVILHQGVHEIFLAFLKTPAMRTRFDGITVEVYRHDDISRTAGRPA